MILKKVKRFHSTLLLLTTVSSLFISSCSEDVPVLTDQVDAPNIILIIADDLGWDAFGDYPGISSIKAHTPTLDSLAENGLTFTNFWTNPVCAPTRAALLTGKYGYKTGVGGAQNPQTATLADSETTIQQYLKNNSSSPYASAVIGKWHVSSSTDLNAPERFGLDYYSGIFRGAAQDYFDWTQTSSGVQTNINTYTTTHFVNQSINWIDQQSKPFFLWLAFNAPHTPFHRPPLDLITDQSLSDDQATINSNPLPYYLSAVEAMDSEIARLINSLTEEEKKNTIFIFMGDNGTPPQVVQSPYSVTSAKNTLFQGGVNVPLVICGKNVTRKNESEIALTQVTDLFSTIADMAGTGLDTYQDGISLKPLFTSANTEDRPYIYTEQFGNNPANQDGYAIRNKSFKLIKLESGTEYLYDVGSDPFEENNLMGNMLTIEAEQNLEELRAFKEGL